MSEQKSFTREEANKYFAVDTNNSTWDLVEKESRSEEETIDMIHRAHASAFDWAKVGQAVNVVRANYLVSKVYFSAGMAEPALFWAEKTWNQTLDLGLDSWDYVFACEIMARAHAARGDRERFDEVHKKAEAALEGLGKEDADLCRGELERGPWFGMR